MEKILTREALIEMMGRMGYYDNLVYGHGEGLAPNTVFDRRLRNLIKPRHKYTVTRDEGFSDIPDEFFVCVMTVMDKYGVNDHVTNTAILNTCINPENYWVFREGLRFLMGTYEQHPAIKQLDMLDVIKPHLALHFPHASVEDPTMIAYTPSYDYGLRDRQVRMKLGKYLTKYYSDVLTQEQIRAYANGAKGLDVKFAEDTDGFRYVYAHGPNSCMSGSTDDFGDIDGPYHPVDVYDTGEFRLAYIEPIDCKIVARAFVHEPSKRWVRAYGDEADTLASWLNENGYTKDCGWQGCQLKIVTDRSGNWVLPYIDGDARGVRSRTNSRWEIVSERPYDVWCDFTDGVCREDMATCDACGSDTPEEDLYWSGYHEIHIGSCCLDDYALAYYRRGQTYIRSDECIYCESDSEYYEYNYAIEYADITEASDGCWYKREDLVRGVDDEWIYVDTAVKAGEDCGEDVFINKYNYDRSLLVQYDGAQPIAVWHPDYMPNDIDVLYNEDTQINMDGVEVGRAFRTMEQLLLSLGVSHTRAQLLKVGMSISEYTLQNWYEHCNKIAA